MKRRSPFVNLVAAPRFERELGVMSLKCCLITPSCKLVAFARFELILQLMRLVSYLITLPRNKIGGAKGNRTPISSLQSWRITVIQMAPMNRERWLLLLDPDAFIASTAIALAPKFPDTGLNQWHRQ